MVELNPTNFFKYYAFNPRSNSLSRKDKNIATLGTVLLGLTAGIGHFICRVFFYSKELAAKAKESAKKVEQITYRQLHPEEYALIDAVKNNDTLKVQELIDQGKVNFNLVDIDGETAFKLAIDQEDHQIFDLLLDSGKVDLNSQKVREKYFTDACFSSGIYKIQRLIEKDQNLVNYSDSQSKMNALMIVTSQNNLEAIRYLLKFINPKDVDKHNFSPMVYAIMGDKVEALKILLEDSRVDVNDLYGPDSASLLAFAAGLNSKQCIDLILQHSNFIPKIISLGVSPLHVAASKGNYEIYSKLKPYFPGDRLLNKDGQTQAQAAYHSGFVELGDRLRRLNPEYEDFWEYSRILVNQFALPIKIQDMQGDKKSFISLDGSSAYQMHKVLNQTVNAHLPANMDPETWTEQDNKEILNALMTPISYLTSLEKPKEANKILIDRYNSFETVVIPLTKRYDQGVHATSLIFNKELKLLIIADRKGEGAGFNIYKMGNDSIEEVVEKITSAQKKRDLVDLADVQLHKDLKLRFLKYVPQSTQKIGSCPWTSDAAPAYRGILIFQRMLNGDSLNKAIKSSKLTYKKMIFKAREDTLRNLIELKLTDPNLIKIRQFLLKAVDKKLDYKMERLEKKEESWISRRAYENLKYYLSRRMDEKENLDPKVLEISFSSLFQHQS